MRSLSFGGTLIGIFTIDPEVVRMGVTLMIFAAIYQLFDAMYIVYYGALRGAGDTFVPGIVTAVLCWGIMVGGGYIVARYFKQLSVAGPWSCRDVYGVILGIRCSIAILIGANWRSDSPGALESRLVRYRID